MTDIFELSNVSHIYRSSGTDHTALKNVSGRIHQGEVLLIMGPSGSGKSTLLHILGFIEPLQSGRMNFLGSSVFGKSDRELSKIRRFNLGFIFQSFFLLDALTVYENVEYFLVKQKVQKKERRARVEGALSAVGIRNLAEKYPLSLSGGQRQRVAIARALAKEPTVIIADEPTANLDQKTAREIFEIFKSLSKKGVTVVMASNDPLAKEYADRTCHLIDGEVKL